MTRNNRRESTQNDRYDRQELLPLSTSPACLLAFSPQPVAKTHAAPGRPAQRPASDRECAPRGPSLRRARCASFKPEYAGKLNFYCNVIDDQLKHASDAPTIGLSPCQRSNQVLAEYALRGLDTPIGVSTFELTRALPESLQSALPSIDAIEAELSDKAGGDGEVL